MYDPWLAERPAADQEACFYYELIRVHGGRHPGKVGLVRKAQR